MTADEARTLVAEGELGDLLGVESGLSELESGFLKDAGYVLDRGLVLTADQAAELHKIWQRHLGGDAT